MTTIFPETRVCSVCGKKHDYPVIGSTNRFGSPDLDLRPPEMQRSTMHYWVSTCPGCGYVAADVSTPTRVIREDIAAASWRTCDGIDFTSPLAEEFYRLHLAGLIDGDRKRAFYALLHAAWACDDARDEENAGFCRRRSLPILREMADSEDLGVDELRNLKIMEADILRRSGLFREVAARFEDVVLGNELLDRLLAFELDRAARGDTACYTVREAMGE